jgi:5'-nucleotidase
MQMRRTLLAVAALAVAAVLVPTAGARVDRGKPKPPRETTTEVQILGLNDFHGNLEPPTGSGGRIGALTGGACVAPTCYLAGGVEYLATHVRNLRATNPRNTVFVSAGDLIGATPLISALFHDEPTIEAFNLMDLDYNGVGNHEFDEGVDELLRMQRGGCHPVDGCQDGDGFEGADFKFLAANVTYKKNDRTIFPSYRIEYLQGGVKVAFIGMTLEGTPQIVTPAGISHVDFHDEADTVNALIPELKEKGVETIVVLLHEGGTTSKAGNGAGDAINVNACGTVSGPLPEVVSRMDDEVDVVVTGHTNWAINCVLDGKIVTGAAHQGRIVTDIDLTISRETGEVESAKVNNAIVTRDVEKAPDLTALVSKYATLVAPLANRVVGSVPASGITRAANAAGESALGDVIADAQLEATSPAAFGGAVVAFMNPGGIRADIAPGEVTYGELFAVQPFANVMTVMTCSGAQIDAILEQQWQASGITNILQVPAGFTYTWDAAAPIGSRVDIATVKIGGVAISPLQTYRVAMNNFLATGGDGFSAFTGCTDPLGGEIDLDALVRYFEAHSPVAPGPQNRITRVN